MSPSLVVEHLDVVEEGHLGLAAALEVLPELGLHRREPALHDGVIVAVATPAHTPGHPVCGEHTLIVLAGIRAPLIGMMQEALRGTSTSQCQLECLEDEMAVIDGTDGPADQEARVEVEQSGQIELPAGPDHDLRRVGDPPLIRGVRDERLVEHIRRDRFRVKTPGDKSVPYFPAILGECPFNFEKGKWYTMQVEVVGEEILARLDAKHFVVGKHPMLNRKREYFAFQVDQSGAAFDNVGIWHAEMKKGWESVRQPLIKKQSTRPWSRRAPEEELKDLKMVTIDRVYRTDAKYRAVVARHEELQASAKKKYPAAYKSSKEGQKEIAKLRTKLRNENSAYKQSVNAINKAKRREVGYLEDKVKGLRELPSNQYRAALEKARLGAMKKDTVFRELIAKREESEKDLLKAYPQLNISNEDVVEGRRKAHVRLRETRSEERRVGKECRSRWSPYH